MYAPDLEYIKQISVRYVFATSKRALRKTRTVFDTHKYFKKTMCTLQLIYSMILREKNKKNNQFLTVEISKLCTISTIICTVFARQTRSDF